MSETEKIKVAILNRYVPVPSINGGEEHTRLLVKYLCRRADVELHVVTLGNKNADFEKDSSGLYLHLVRKQFFFPSYIPHAVPGLRHRVNKINPDIIHVLGLSIPYATTAALLKSKYPTVLTAFTFTPYAMKYENRLQIVKLLLTGKANQKYVLSKIQNIMADTSSIKNLTSSAPDSKIYVLPAGIEFEEIKRIEPHQEEKPDIFSACRLHKIKGIDILIRAITTVIKSVPDLKVYIAGSGPQEDELKNLVRELNLEKHVRFLGVVYGEEKYRYYKGCKFGVALSRWDFSPITIYESMACGKPVIASTETRSEILEDGETGLLFESGNIEDLANKMLFLLQNKESRDRMGEAALKRAEEYDWSKTAERTVEVYRGIIADFHEQKAGKK